LLGGWSRRCVLEHVVVVVVVVIVVIVVAAAAAAVCCETAIPRSGIAHHELWHRTDASDAAGILTWEGS
jgi:hypothetical protein